MLEMTVNHAIVVKLVERYLTGLLDPSITLLEVHKLMYFMQEFGEPLHLKFTKASYGPYAENLRHVLNVIEGHYISRYADGGDTPDKGLQLVPGAAEEADLFLQNHPETRRRFDKVSQWVEGFESPFGLELLATTHWVIKHESAISSDEVAKKIYGWNERKRQFTPRQIALAMQVVAGV